MILLRMIIHLIHVVVFITININVRFPTEVVSSSRFLRFLLHYVSPDVVDLFFSNGYGRFSKDILYRVSSLRVMEIRIC